MSVARKIAIYASALFDVVGATKPAKDAKLLIVGLESMPQRDLDEFRFTGGDFQLCGFERHAMPKLVSLLGFIHKQGFIAELVGWCGYPLRGEINLKEEAVQIGLGRWGKSTLVLHPRYGNRLRFMAVRTNAPLEPPTGSLSTREENPTCSGCTICLDACPENVLEPYCMLETSRCLADTAHMANEDGRLIVCDVCLRLCPAGK